MYDVLKNAYTNYKVSIIKELFVVSTSIAIFVLLPTIFPRREVL